MFESYTKTATDRDREAAEGRSPDEIASLRLAAVLFLVTSFISIPTHMVLGSGIPPVPSLIGLGLAWYLYKLRPRAEALALGLAVLGAIVAPLATLRQGLAVAVLGSIPAWGFGAAIALLLTGAQNRARRLVALVVFGFLTVGLMALLWILRLVLRLGAE